MVSSHPKSKGIPWVDELSTRPPDLGCHIMTKINKKITPPYLKEKRLVEKKFREVEARVFKNINFI